MRVLSTVFAGVVSVVLAVAAVTSLSATDAGAVPNKRVACSERSGVLGVSRVLEVDTTGGPRFGNMQYKDIDFLKRGEVVLTFDDGPLRPKTTSVLNALEAHCTKATFFMVGRMALVDPGMVKEIDRRGHTVATHSWSHRMQGRISKSSAKKEFELGLSAVSLALGKPAAPFFRFPYLSDPRSMQAHLKSRDQGIFSIDVDSVDFRTRSGKVMINRTMRSLKRLGKGILLFHDIQRSTASGIDVLLDRLHKEGYKVVHLVAKQPSTTLPQYDALAQKEAERRKKIASRRPLASRSIVWPVSRASDFPAPVPLKIDPPGLFKGPLPERSGIDRSAQIANEKPEATAEKDTKASGRTDSPSNTSKTVSRSSKQDQGPELKNSIDDWRQEFFNN